MATAADGRTGATVRALAFLSSLLGLARPPAGAAGHTNTHRGTDKKAALPGVERSAAACRGNDPRAGLLFARDQKRRRDRRRGGR